ncbi:hypothetical protein [Roseateles oligotrophus]|uniref:Lipoprotein n=1 Tax=Roseateles oligotrophus TaxID=1769250 RepID=A0ABT2YLE9_9BURK|nr:hypothetical protein [Roseateles oligotrophus]MCV2370882.1 hypothetical protein [Roseateles oligotrophus]
MKRLAFALTCVVGLLIAASAKAADIGVSINIGQPGFYGHIDIGNAPQPRLIYAKPIMIEHSRQYVAPVYLRVSPGHEKDWRKHCKHYNACGQNVYFVRDDWYQNEYVPHYQSRGESGRGERDREEHGNGNGNGHGKGHGKGKGKGHD